MTSWGRALHGKALRCDGRRDIKISFLISALFSIIYINGSGGKFKWYLKKPMRFMKSRFPGMTPGDVRLRLRQGCEIRLDKRPGAALYGDKHLVKPVPGDPAPVKRK
jgi:hypothetical protein